MEFTRPPRSPEPTRYYHCGGAPPTPLILLPYRQRRRHPPFDGSSDSGTGRAGDPLGAVTKAAPAGRSSTG